VRQPSSIGQQKEIPSVGLSSEIKMPDRLVTAVGGGLPELRAEGPKRQIYDKSYYVNLLKSKNIELQNEINRLKDEVEKIGKDNQLYVQLERQFEQLIQEVRTLEGELADHNLALDKQRSDTKPEDIMAVLYHIQNQNEKQKIQLDEIFVERKKREEEISGIEEEINMISSANEERLSELDPEQKNQYEKLKEEERYLQSEINRKRNELEIISSKLAQTEARLRQDIIKMKSQQLREEKSKLVKKKEELELQTGDMNLPFNEARERLTQRTKEDQNDIKNIETRTGEIKKLIETYNKQLKEMVSDMAERKADNAELKNYEILQEKDTELTNFISNFEQTKRQELEQKNVMESKIEKLLEKISRAHRKILNLPSIAQFNEIMKEGKNKEGQVKIAEKTLEFLHQDLQEKTVALQRLNGLDVQLSKDMKIFTEKIEKMENEMKNKFSKVNENLAEMKEKLGRMTRQRAHYIQNKEALNNMVEYLSMKVDSKKTQLHDNETFKSLNDLEQKLSSNESSIFGLKTFIDSKSQELNYEVLANECLSNVQAINSEIIKEVSSN